jgi:hypothetical protein
MWNRDELEPISKCCMELSCRMLKIKAETDRSQTGQTVQTSEIIVSAIRRSEKATFASARKSLGCAMTFFFADF